MKKDRDSANGIKLLGRKMKLKTYGKQIEEGAQGCEEAHRRRDQCQDAMLTRRTAKAQKERKRLNTKGGGARPSAQKTQSKKKERKKRNEGKKGVLALGVKKKRKLTITPTAFP